ncbi:MAG: hypothetical protein M0R17_02635 [Candidatus Omnitrophica bacterium]|jgi:hypothetical protein|nr:hypothetical protein [Candidatus Omnitrophota bacterium]
MKVIHDKTGEYPDALNNYYFYNLYNDNSQEEILFQGYNTSINENLKLKYKDYKRKIYLNLEAPCAFTSTSNAISSQEYFDKIYTICPYTADWLNKDKKKYFPIAFPMNIKYLNSVIKDENKMFDVIYQGNITNQEQENIINLLPEFKYIFTTLQTHRLQTHFNIPTISKWKLLKQSKINITINACPINDYHVNNIKTYKNWNDNIAFSNLQDYYIPQFKSRVIEAAACKTLNLIKYDTWNVMEYWFNKDEFIYWKSIEELKKLIIDITLNYNNYTSIIDKAYNKVLNYDSEVIFNKIKDRDERVA